MVKRMILISCLFVFLLGTCYGQDDRANAVRLSLKQALQEALSNNDQLKAIQSKLRAAEALTKEAGGALLPNIDANFNYAYLDIVPGFKRTVLGNVQNDFFPQLSVRQSLFTGGKLKQTKEAAVADARSAEFTLLNGKLGVELNVSLTYYELLSLLSQIRILQENREQLTVQQQYARLLVEAGRMSQLELHRLRVEIANVDGKLLKLNNDYLSSSHNLGVLMGRAVQQAFLPSDSLTVSPLPVDTTQIVQIALENNPLWARFEWQVRQKEAKIRIAKASHLPQISAAAWYGYEFGTDSFDFSRNDRYFVGLTAQMPIFDGGVIGARIDKAVSDLEEVKWQKAFFQKSLAAQTHNLYLRVREMEAQIRIQEQAVKQAQESYRLALIEYHAGRRSNTDLLDIQKGLLNSKLQLSDAIVSYNKSKAQLLFTLGIL